MDTFYGAVRRQVVATIDRGSGASSVVALYRLGQSASMIDRLRTSGEMGSGSALLSIAPGGNCFEVPDELEVPPIAPIPRAACLIRRYSVLSQGAPAGNLASRGLRRSRRSWRLWEQLAADLRAG